MQDMPAAEVAVDEPLVRALLEEQFPEWAALPLTPFAFGWDNALLRLGDDLLVRLPRRQMAAVLVEHEQRWLPVLAPVLPVPIPVPVGAGRPGCGYPWSWSVVPYFEGRAVARCRPEDVAEFVVALHRPAPDDAPPNPYRGIPLADRAEVTERCLDGLGLSARAGPVWRDASAAPPWDGPAIWLHGDLHPANLLAAADATLSAVIDWGDICAGDPATDLAVAWMAFDRADRAAFHEAVSPDEAQWARAKGWALSLGATLRSQSADNPLMAQIAERTLAAVLDDACD